MGKVFLKSIIILLLFCPLICVNAFDDKIVLQSAIESDSPPFCIVTKDGKATGFSVELLKYVANIMNLEISFKVDQWADTKNELKMEKLDVLPFVSYSKEKTEYFKFSIPYLVLCGGIFVRDNNTVVKTRKDLYGAEVMVLEGAPAHEYMLKNKLTDKLFTTKSYAEAFKMLATGKHDAVVALKLRGLYAKDSLGLNNLKLVGGCYGITEDTVKPLGKEIEGFEKKFCFAVSVDKCDILAKLNEGLLIAVNNGTYDKLYHKWFFFLDKQIDMTNVIKYVLMLIVVVVIIILLLAFFIFKKQIKRRTREIEDISKFPSEDPFPIVRVDFNQIILYTNKSISKILDKDAKKEVKVGSRIGRWESLIDEVIKTNKIKYDVETNEGDRVFSWAFVPISTKYYINIYGSEITKRSKYGEKLKKSHIEIEQAHKHAMYMLAIASEYKDRGTGGHIKRIVGMTAELALEVGVESKQAEQMGADSILHDLGKLGISDYILLKPSKLTEDESEIMKQHTSIGAKIIGDDKWFAQARQIALLHHERWDGSGYLQGLRGKAIPLAARIVAVADVFDALISKRAYSEPWSLEKVIDKMKQKTGSHFDPKIFAAFLSLYQKGKLNKYIYRKSNI
jgi:HD-GYP domain-containing protein (c-di-GMP phosphodiesterase class II)/ABC-type amino acid transport substrate-binding protein